MSDFTLEAILEGDSTQLGDAITSIAASVNSDAAELRRQMAAKLCQQLLRSPQLDAGLAPLFSPIEPVLVAQIAADDQFYCSPEHPLRRFLETLLPPAAHWFARDSKPSQQFYDKLDHLLHQVAAGEGAADKALAEFSQWLGSEDKRAALLESRLCETELSNLKMVAAQTRVIESLNTTLAQRPLPTELHNAIGHQLKSELQYWASNTPADELANLPLWKHWQRILPVLGQLFTHEDIQVEDQVLYSQIPALLVELERSLTQPTSNTAAYTQCVEQLSQCLMAAVKKQEQDISLFAALPLPEGQSSSNTKVPLTLLQATEQIRVGDWIIVTGDNGELIRCKLALKNPAVDQLLFVDHTGRKVMSKSNKDFALCLSTGIAQPLREPHLPRAINTLLKELVEQANRGVKAQLLKQKQKAEALVRAFIAEQQAAAEAAERKHQAEQTRIQAELDARHAAARKAMAEARVLADEQRRREAEQAADAERLRIEQEALQAAETLTRQQSSMQTVNELQVGAWLEITSAGTPVRAKLSVIIGSTGKYIFADQVGRKIAEYSREQLLALLASGEIKVLRNGDNFEEQLAKVIRGLRRDVN